jgi:membrane protease YdiL (CAAX protease family)
MPAAQQPGSEAASLAGTPPTSGPSRFRRWTEGRPLTAFLVLVLGVSWPVLALLVLADHGVIPGREVPVELFALALTLLVLLPAALWVTWATEGRAGVRALLGRAFRWRISPIWWLVVLLGLPVATVALGVAFGGSVRTTSLLPVLGQGALLLLIAVVLVNLWEEVAWVGFFQTRLERRHNLFVAALLTAVPFAGIHAPLLLLGRFTAGSVMFGIAGLLVLGVLFRLMAGVVLRGAADSVLAIGVLHAVFDASNNQGGVVDTLLSGADQSVFILPATVIVTVVTAVAIRRRLGRAYRQGTVANEVDVRGGVA